MKRDLTYLLFFTLCCCSVSQKSGPVYDLAKAPELFDEFIVLYNRNYTKEEKKMKYEIFRENLVDINRINSDDELTRVAEINEESDLTPEERRKAVKLPDSVSVLLNLTINNHRN